MSEQQRRVYEAIIGLPEDVCNRILEYIDEIRFNMVINNAPEELIPKNEEDLQRMLEEADKDVEAGDVYSLDEVVADINKLLLEWGAMLYKYTIKFSKKAKEDIALIVNYITNNIKEPQIAKSYANLFFSEINSLHIFPKRNPIVKGKSLLGMERRKFIVKNYVVFYLINENEKTVFIERIVYGASDWINKL